MIAKYIGVYVSILLISIGFFAGGSYIFIKLATAMVWLLQEPYGIIAIPLIGYLVLLGGAVAAVGLSGIISMIGVLYWILRNSKEYRKYILLSSNSDESIEEPSDWLRNSSERINGAQRIEETTTKLHKLETLYFTSRSKHTYSPAFTLDTGGFHTTWMTLTNNGVTSILARVELESQVPHFVVNSTIESGELLPNKYSNGNKVNLEGDTNDYFTLTVAGSHQSVALEILPPDVLYKLLRNFDEFDLEFRDSHLDIVMNLNQNEQVLTARIRRIEEFLTELRKEMTLKDRSALKKYDQLLRPRRTITFYTDSIASRTVRVGVRVFPFVFILIAICLFWLLLNDTEDAPLLATIFYAAFGAGMVSVIIVVQWTLSTLLFLLGLSVAYHVVQGFIMGIRREFFSKKYAYYYKLEEMPDSQLINTRQS